MLFDGEFTIPLQRQTGGTIPIGIFWLDFNQHLSTYLAHTKLIILYANTFRGYALIELQNQS